MRLAVVASLATGCAARTTKVTVTYHSDPPGATIYEAGKRWGSAPMGLIYRAPGRFRECLAINPITLRWVSGAQADITGLQACPADGRQQQFTVFRPSGVPGVEIDAHYAAALLQQRAAAPADTPSVMPQPSTCTSQVIGRQIFTRCTP